MNFYIFNSNKKSSKLIFFFLTCLLACFFFADIAISLYESKRTTSEYYIDVLSSKAEHMRKRFPAPTKVDVIFIGSSLTRYHVDTNFLTKKGITSYNLSLVSHFPLSYPSMVDSAIKMNPKAIALELNVPWLFEDFENRIPTPGTLDILAQIKCGLPLATVGHFSLGYLEQLSLISRYAVTLCEKSKAYLNKLIFGYMPKTPTKQKGHTATHAKKVNIVKLSNGDGILCGTDLDAHDIATLPMKDLSHIRKKNVDFFNYIISMAQKKGIKVFIYLAASMKTPKDFNLKRIKDEIHAPIINLVHAVPPTPEYWADKGHLNSSGREIYSAQMLDKLKTLTETGSL
ncbi:hypothetical protein D0S45_05675 [Marinifilum sp. JC120]|nr:hypothetical protein D0S45_05675 [Marinifilum sp. JC120]